MLKEISIIIENIKRKTSDSIDDIFQRLQTFPMRDEYLDEICFCNKDRLNEFKSEYFTIINQFIHRPKIQKR